MSTWEHLLAGRVKRYLLISTIAVVLTLAAIGFGLVPVNLFFAKQAIREMLHRELGVDVEIHGPLRIRFGSAAALTASRIALRLGPADEEPLLQITHLAVKARLRDLLDGNVILRGIRISGASVDYCQGVPSGLGPTPAPPDKPEPPPSIVIGKLRIDDIRPVCSNEEMALEFLPQRLDFEASAPLGAPIEASVKGRKGENEIKLMISGGSLAELLDDPPDYAFDLKLQAPESDFTLTGSVSSPFSDPAISVRGELVSALLESVTGSRRLSFSGMARDFRYRPYFELDASLPRLDLQRLMDGARRPGGHEEQTNIRPAYDFLARFDAQAKIGIDRVLNAPLPLDDLSLEARLEEGVLAIDKARLLLAGSPVEAEALFEVGSDCVRLDGSIRISGFDLHHLNRFLVGEASLDGRLDKAELRSSSCGNSVLQHVESLQTSVTAGGLAGSWSGEKLPLRFHSLQAEINWREMGGLSFDGELLEERFHATAGFGSIEAIRSGNRWPLSIKASGAAARLALEGEAGFGESGPDFELDMDFKASRFGSLHAWIGSAPENELPLQGRASLKLGKSGFAANDLDVRLGNSDFAGNVFWMGPRGAHTVTLALHSQKLDIGELSGLFPKGRERDPAEEPGWAELLTRNEWTETWSGLPRFDIDLSAKRVDGLGFALADTALRAGLTDRSIEDGWLKLNLEGISVEGTLDADFRDSPWNVAYETVFEDIDIGRALAAFDLADDVDALAQRAHIRFTSEGETLEQLTENSRWKSEIEDLRWAFRTGPENTLTEVELSVLELTNTPASATTWLASGQLNDVPLRVWMETPPLMPLFDPTKTLPVKLAFTAGDDVTVVNAVIDRRNPAHRLVNLSVSGEFRDLENLDLSRLEAPLKDYDFRSDVSIRQDEVLFSQLQLRIGSSHASGDIGIRYREPNYDFDIELDSPFLETEDLVRLAENWRNLRLLHTGTSLVETGPAEPENRVVTSGVMTLASESVDAFTGANDFDVDIGIDELRSSGLLLGDARLNLKVEGSEILVDPLQITGPATRAEARYFRKEADAGFEYGLEINVEGLEYGGLLRLMDPESRASGELFLNASLVSTAPDAAQAVNHLQGTLDLAVFPEDIQAGFLDLWASNLIIALLPGRNTSDKKLNCMVGRFEMEDGVMNSRNAFLDSTDIVVRVRGEIDLVDRKLDLLIAPQSKREKFFSVSTPIAVTGPFSDYSIGVAPGGFLTTGLRLYYNLLYVPWKWLTGERFPPDGMETCYRAMGWEWEDNVN